MRKNCNREEEWSLGGVKDVFEVVRRNESMKFIESFNSLGLGIGEDFEVQDRGSGGSMIFGRLLRDG